MLNLKVVFSLLLIVCAIFSSIGCVDVESDDEVVGDSNTIELESGEDIYISDQITHFSIPFEQRGDYNVIKYYDPDLKSWIMILHEEDGCVAQIIIFADDGSVKATVGQPFDV